MQMKNFYRSYRRALKVAKATWDGRTEGSIWVKAHNPASSYPNNPPLVCPLNLVRNVKLNPPNPTYLIGAVDSGKALGLTEDQSNDVIVAADNISTLTPRQRQIRAALLRAVESVKV